MTGNAVGEIGGGDGLLGIGGAGEQRGRDQGQSEAECNAHHQVPYSAAAGAASRPSTALAMLSGNGLGRLDQAYEWQDQPEEGVVIERGEAGEPQTAATSTPPMCHTACGSLEPR